MSVTVTDRADAPSETAAYDTELTTPALVIGAGAAGARTAIGLEQAGITPLVIGKRQYGDAHTVWAAGGINASLNSLDPEDTWQIHAADTLVEGHFINDAAGVEQVTETMPDRIAELEAWGMEFARTDDGAIDQRYFGAQSFRRTCYVGDRTGEAILDTLVGKAQSLEIPYRENLMITSLVTEGGQVYGAVGFDMDSGDSVLIRSNYVVLAAGGYSAVYDRHSSRDEENNGDATALALQAGVPLVDMEFVQFHPTGMVVDEDDEDWAGRLVTEAVRGEGGRLFNADGERFMEAYSPEQMELDARDVVARAIRSELQAGRGTDNGAVYLDISHRDRAFIKQQLPRMYDRFDGLGVDIAEEPMEIAPTAHYSMGGCDIDFETGETAIERLYAVGEATGGVHGANRLGGNSLAETVAIGAVAADAIASEYDPAEPVPTVTPAEDTAVELNTRPDSDGSYTPTQVMDHITEVMTNHGGIVRDDETLAEGLNKLTYIENTMLDDMAVDGATSRSREFSYDAEFMLMTARCVLRGARQRTESRGAHYRTDHPDRAGSHTHNIVYEQDADGALTTRTRDPDSPSDSVQAAVDEGHTLDYHHLE